MSERDELPMWTIYQSPTDYPGQFVVRRFVMRRGVVHVDAEPCFVAPTLDRARKALPQRGLVRMERAPADERQIVEVWF